MINLTNHSPSEMEPEIESQTQTLPPRRRNKILQVKLALSGMAFLSLGALAIYVTQTALPQSQNLGSQAAARQNKSWIAFVPLTITPSSSTLAKPRLMVRKTGRQAISTATIEFTYDASKISNLSAQIQQWAPKKQPIILKPFTTSVSGTQGKASITLGAPCDEQKCYPIKRLSAALLILNFNAVGNSQITPTANTFITLTGVSENSYDHSLSKALNIVVQE